MLTGPTAFSTLLARLITAVRTALTGSLGGDVGIACVVPGDIAIDTCECDGSIWATLHEQYHSDSFPSGGQARGETVNSACRSAWVVGACELMIARCAPNPQGEPPLVDCVDLEASAQVTNSDAWIILDTIACTLEGYKLADDIIDYLVSTQMIVGPSGGCVGSSIQFSIALDRGTT
jgi:hypothetical protein